MRCFGVVIVVKCFCFLLLVAYKWIHTVVVRVVRYVVMPTVKYVLLYEWISGCREIVLLEFVVVTCFVSRVQLFFS